MLVLAVTLTGCASSQSSNADRPYVEATSQELPPLETSDLGDLTHPDFEGPQMIGGLDALSTELESVTEGWTCPVRGRVSLQFVVNEDGDVTEARALESIHEECDQMAVKTIKRVSFSPATIDGEPTPALLSIPVTFD
mgnify:CR=1 FL=1